MTAIHTPNIKGLRRPAICGKNRLDLPARDRMIAASLRKPTGHWLVRWAIFIMGAIAMNIYTVSFFGHRIIDRPLPVERRIEALIQKLLSEKEYVEFLVGRDGDFDQLASSTVRRCKRTFRDDNSALVWVMPYETAEYRENEEAFHSYYDDIEVCSVSACCHYKKAHQARNREMVSRSDLVVFFVDRKTGGSYQTLQFARKTGKHIVNLAQDTDE